MTWLGGPITSAELDGHWHAGRLPLDLADSMSVGEAAGVVLSLPTVTGDPGAPVGYGVSPPEGGQPIVRLAKRVVDLFNEPIRKGARGVVGAMWRDRFRPDRPVFRLWFRAEPGHGFRPEGTPAHVLGAFRIVDTYDDAIGSVVGIEDAVPHSTGWQIVRLDQAPELVAAIQAAATVAPTGSSTLQRSGLPAIGLDDVVVITSRVTPGEA